MDEDEFNRIVQEMPNRDCHETGSRYICNPPVMDTDEDWIFDCSEKGQYQKAADYLRDNGFSMKDIKDDDYDEICENFMSFRKDDLNIIICNKHSFFKKFLLATYIAKELNILEKPKRILLFQAIIYGRYDGEEF